MRARARAITLAAAPLDVNNSSKLMQDPSYFLNLKFAKLDEGGIVGGGIVDEVDVVKGDSGVVLSSSDGPL